LLFAFYWLPSIIAAVRKVHGTGQVIVVNLFLGWTAIGCGPGDGVPGGAPSHQGGGP